MDGMTIVWIAVGLVVLLIVVALVAAAAKRSKIAHAEHERQEALDQELLARATAAAERQQAAEDASAQSSEFLNRAEAIDPDTRSRVDRAAAEARFNGHSDRSPHAATWGRPEAEH